MKLIFSAALGLALLAAVPADAAQRLVLIEDFTNYNCPPCNAIRMQMDSIFWDNRAVTITPLRYHMNWPAPDDPFYNFNIEENISRRYYYGVNYVPTFRYDGKRIHDPSDAMFPDYPSWYAWFHNAIDSLAAIPAPIRINLSHYTAPAGGDPDSIHMQIDVIAEQAVSGDLRLRGSVTEEWVRIVPFGKFYYIFRDMAPLAADSSDGDPIPNLSAGDSLHFEYVLPYDSAVYHFGRMMTTVWVQNDLAGADYRKVYNSVSDFIPDITTDVADGAVPLRLVLDQNAPNPFNPTTAISFTLDRTGEVRLSVFAPTGRLVTDLVDGVVREGSHSVTWDGRDHTGHDVGSGVYYYRLDTDKTSLTKKMVLVR